MTLKLTSIIFIFLSLLGCSSGEPDLPEVRLAKQQDLALWRAGSHLYLPEQYSGYRSELNNANADLLKVNACFRLFRDYQQVRAEFAQLLRHGDELSQRLGTEKQVKAKNVGGQINDVEERLSVLKKATSLFNEGRLARGSLMKARVLLAEARSLFQEGKHTTSEEKLKEAQGHMDDAEKAINPVLNHYQDKAQITKWSSWAEETIKESRQKGIYVILVNKAERKLTVYRHGKAYKTYGIGIGLNGSLHKLRAGDHATPEGRYKIIARKAQSRYYKALLINYPNETDRHEFLRARRMGLISGSAGIGGLIEIHGGGKNGMSYGCVSLDNAQMEELFNTVLVGTPVTIVGAVNVDNAISAALKSDSPQ